MIRIKKIDKLEKEAMTKIKYFFNFLIHSIKILPQEASKNEVQIVMLKKEEEEE